MVWVYARSIIAPVQDAETVWNVPVVKHPRYSMSTMKPIINADFSVVILVDSVFPIPT